MSERTNKSGEARERSKQCGASKVNERTDERRAKYLRPDSWLFRTTVHVSEEEVEKEESEVGCLV